MSVQKEKTKCLHLVTWKDMCGDCGLDLSKLDTQPTTSSDSNSYVSMIHTVPDLKVSLTDARIIDKDEETRLLREKKLHLLVDLDQTLIHTTNDNVPPNLQDVIHFQLWGANSPWYHTRLRPGTREFLKNVSSMYQLHICTFGTRNYAHMIARHLDPEGKYFYNRILSRDECFSQNSKTANLKELFPNGDHMVCIIDDREDVWNFASNLILVKPYHFFRHTGDINAPPGLAKKDNDDKTGFDFSKVDQSLGIVKGEKPQIAEADSTTTTENNCSPPEATNSEADATSTTSESTKKRELKRTESAQVTNDLELSSESSDSSSSDSSSSSSSDSEEKANDGDNESGNENSVDSKCDNSPKPMEGAKTQELKTTPTVPEESAESKPSSETKNAEDIGNKDNEVLPIPSVNSESPIAGSDVPDSRAASAGGDPTTTNKSDEKEDAASDVEPVVSEVVVPPPAPGEDVIKVEDQDDYLLYLEDILKQIHLAYYTLHEESKGQENCQGTDVKVVIPYVRKKILKGCNIVFSGVVPVDVAIESSRAYSVALGLGATVTDKIIPPAKPNAAGSSKELTPTTHVVAARPGTAKVNDARRHKNIHVVTPDWLWCCSERWEHVDEKLFSLYNKSGSKEGSPDKNSSEGRKSKRAGKKGDADDDSIFSSGVKGSPKPGARRTRTPSGRFMDTINPLLSFSMDEIESMGHEVDDICNETGSESSSSSSEETPPIPPPNRKVSRSQSLHDQENARILAQLEKIKESSSSSDSDLDSSQETRRKRKLDETETDDEPLNSKFRRGEALPSDIDTLNLTNASSDDDDVEVNQEDERMAQEVERGFLDDLDDSQDQFDA